MNQQMNKFLFLALTAFGISSCSMTGTNLQTDDLIGEWQIVKATRDGAETETLSGLFFHFLDKEEVITNLSGIGSTAMMYSRTGNKLIFDGDEKMAIEVLSMNGDTMHMVTFIKDMEFKMWLVSEKSEPIKE